MNRGYFRKLRRLAGPLIKVLRGYVIYCYRNQTPPESYLSMRQLYCLTDGRFNDAVSWAAGLLRRPYAIRHSSGPTGDIEPGEIKRIADELKEKGYYVFEQRLPEALCDDLLRFALETPAQVLLAPDSTEFKIRYGDSNVVYDRGDVVSAKYNLPLQAVVGHAAVQQLLTDEKLLAIAQSYLGARPIIDLVAMWWSTAFLHGPSSEAAQLFHFDMDRIKFLKFFFYLTDVRPENGPHVYVAKSHTRKPAALRRDGRISDGEIERTYAPADVVEIAAPRGTIFVADTRGFHKGKHLEAGDRLILQIEFATSLFGQNYPVFQINDEPSPGLRMKAKKYKRTFSNFIPAKP